MNVRTQRRLYWLTAAALGVTTAALWSTTRLEAGGDGEGWYRGDPKDSNRSVIKPDVAEVETEPTAFGSFGLSAGPGDLRVSGVWDKPLRRPLYDPPPPPPPQIPPPPPLRLKLLGTIVESGRSEAIVSVATGQIEMARVGTTLDDATIRSIEDGRITVDYHDQTLTLEPQP